MNADEFIAAARERLSDLISPIDGGPGADVSYDESFETMKGEVDKMQAIEGGRVDWETIASNGKEILEERSKDFRVILYWAAAKTKLGACSISVTGSIRNFATFAVANSSAVSGT